MSGSVLLNVGELNLIISQHVAVIKLRSASDRDSKETVKSETLLDFFQAAERRHGIKCPKLRRQFQVVGHRKQESLLI